MKRLDKFTGAYIEAALWASTDDNDTPLDRNYSVDDIAPVTLEEMIADARQFQTKNAEDLEALGDERGGLDFWLTRNGHGAGFWDGDWPEPQATRLSEAARGFGEYNLYVGDDGLIYGS